MLLVLAAVAFGAENRGDLNFGTIVVATYSTSRITVAADSRATFEDGRFQDTHCKLAEINPHLVFAVTGVLEDKSPALPRKLRFDAIELAKRAARNAVFDPELNQNHIQAIAQHWAGTLAYRMNQAPPPHMKQWKLTTKSFEILIKGVFAGINDDGKLVLSVGVVEYAPPLTGWVGPTIKFYTEKIGRAHV